MIPQRFKESIDRYVQHGISTGSFLQSVLENDLKGAIGRADTEALLSLKDIVQYCYNEIPSECWGSKENVKDWLQNKIIYEA